MTWYLKPYAAPAAPATTPTPTRTQRATAAARMQYIEDDSWGRSSRARASLLDEIAEATGASREPRIYQSQVDRARHVFSLVEKARLHDPSAFEGLPSTMEEFEIEVTRRRQAEYDAASAVVGAAPAGSWGAEFAGRAVAGMTDEMSVVTLPLGAGVGAGIKGVIATEAAISAGSELAIAPRRQQVAADLDVPEPNIVADVALAGALGGALGGAIAGAPKAVRAARDRYYAYRNSRLGVPAPDTPPSANAAAVADAQTALQNEVPVAPPTGLHDGISESYYAAIRSAESGGNDAAKNPLSSATGRYQFTTGTWNEVARRHPELGLTPDGRLDPAQQEAAIRAFTQDNADILRTAGIPPTNGNLYAAHFLGAGGARSVLSAPINERLANILPPEVISANPFLRNMSVGDFKGWAHRKAGGSSAGEMMPDPYYATQAGYTGRGQVTAGDGTRIDVEYEVVDASLLKAASGRFQPRDRSRINSDAWISDTAARLDPAQLMPSPTADRGTPIVGPDGMVESGNGRMAAINRAYDQHPDRAAAYREQIVAAGYEIPDGIDRPILVARRRTDMTDDQLEAFTIAAQDSGVARMTPTEIARSTARSMTAERLATLLPGARLGDAENRPFLQGVLSSLPRSERNAMFDPSGALNADGARNLRRAFFARAWDAPDLLARYAEAEDAGELKSLMDALDQAAPQWATLRAEIEAGQVRPEFDITGHVVEAMRMIAQAREMAAAGQGGLGDLLTELLNDIDLLDGAVSPLTQALVRKFWRGGRVAAADEIGALLARYAAEARTAGRTGDLLGASPADVLRTLDRAAFGNLPDDLGAVRGAAHPVDVEAIQFAEAAAVDDALAPEVIASEGAALRDIEDDLKAARDNLGDLTFRLHGENGPEASLDDLLDDIADDETLSAVLDICTGRVA